MDYFTIDATIGYFAVIADESSIHVPFFIKAQIFVYGCNQQFDDSQKLKVFRIVPIYNWTRKYITLDKLSMLQILNTQRPRGQCYTANTTFQEIWLDNVDIGRLSSTRKIRISRKVQWRTVDAIVTKN